MLAADDGSAPRQRHTQGRWRRAFLVCGEQSTSILPTAAAQTGSALA